MRQVWWKVAGALLVIYSVVAGLAVPLKPGIESITPDRIEAGEFLVMQVQGYNTYFARANGEIRAWLKLTDTFALAAKQVQVQNNRRAAISFSLPEEFPLRGEVHRPTLVINDPVHGSMVTPSAIFIRHCIYNSDANRIWVNTSIDQLHKAPGFYFPFRAIIYESIRNTFFHVPMWFSMITLFFASGWYSIRFVRTANDEYDQRAAAFAHVGLLLGMAGMLTGMIWSNYAWGAPWSWDIKQNTSAITLLIYFAYFILRRSFDERDRKARISAVYNIFACAMIIPLLFVLPRMTDSLHPGSGGNPAFGGEDLDRTMRVIFYPAVAGWILVGWWIATLKFRLGKVSTAQFESN